MWHKSCIKKLAKLFHQAFTNALTFPSSSAGSSNTFQIPFGMPLNAVSNLSGALRVFSKVGSTPETRRMKMALTVVGWALYLLWSYKISVISDRAYISRTGVCIHSSVGFGVLLCRVTNKDPFSYG